MMTTTPDILLAVALSYGAAIAVLGGGLLWAWRGWRRCRPAPVAGGPVNKDQDLPRHTP
jgi:hypothetical protein